MHWKEPRLHPACRVNIPNHHAIRREAGSRRGWQQTGHPVQGLGHASRRQALARVHRTLNLGGRQDWGKHTVARSTASSRQKPTRWTTSGKEGFYFTLGTQLPAFPQQASLQRSSGPKTCSWGPPSDNSPQSKLAKRRWRLLRIKPPPIVLFAEEGWEDHGKKGSPTRSFSNLSSTILQGSLYSFSPLRPHAIHILHSRSQKISDLGRISEEKATNG